MPTRWVVLHVTDRCQLACRHCLRDPAATPADLPVPLADRVLGEARRLHRADHVALTGGEPSLHPELPALLEAIVRHGYTFHLVTGGRGFDRVLVLLDNEPRIRHALSAVDVSIEGADAASHDALRGKGSWREAMGAAAAVRARGIPLTLQMTVNAENVGQIDSVGLLASHLGAARLSFSMTQPTGTPFDERLHLSRQDWHLARDRVERLAEALRIPVSGTESWERPQPYHACEPLRGELLHVDPFGRLNLCCQHSGVPGGERTVVADLARTSLADAHRQLLELAHRFQVDKLAAMEAEAIGEWDLFPCNYCLRYFGMPHWTDQGSAGARARRERMPGRRGDR
jgi:MoaA/NifB/PqqE/SkfB family radical SAM enzyme